MSKLTCRGCGKELENCTCDVLTTKKEQTEKLKLIGKDEMLCVSLPFGWCFDEVKDLIEASCIFQLEADQLVVNKLQAERDAAIYKVGRLSRELGAQDFRIKDLERINEAHHKENNRLNKRIEELEEQNEYLKEVLISPLEADHCILALKDYWKNEECICVTSALSKLQKIIDKRG